MHEMHYKESVREMLGDGVKRHMLFMLFSMLCAFMQYALTKKLVSGVACRDK